ncbi:unnamed protein product, partial [Rotaria sp. Silwood1]
NVIKCAHCQGDHMVVDPSCSVKSGKRQEKNQRLKILHGTSTSTAQQQHKQVWSGNSKEYLFSIKTATDNTTSTTVQNNNNNHRMDIVDMFEKINDTMLYIKQQQDDINEKFDAIAMKLNTHNNNIGRIKYCIYEIINLLVKEISNQIQLKARDDGPGDKTSVHECTTSNRDLYQTTTYES